MNSGIDIRTLRRSDIPSFREAAVASWLDAYDGILRQEIVDDVGPMMDRAIARRFDKFTVAIVAGEVAGYFSLGDTPEELNYLWHLYVAPKFQRRGVGTALHEAALDAIRARGCDHARLDVATLNEKALRFYRRHGWRETGRDSYENLELIVMERNID